MSINTTVNRDSKQRSGIAHGGIGTGGIELRADGIFRNINIFNNSPFGTGPKFPFKVDSFLFFKVRWQEEGQNPKMKLLQIEEGYEVGSIRSQPIYYIFPWMTGVDKIEYSASFPFSTLLFSDEEMPFDIKLEVFTPFIPHDVKNSALPGIYFNYEVILKGNKKCEVLLMASARNCVGYDTNEREYVTNISQDDDILLCEMKCDNMKGDEPTYGSQTLASMSSDSSYYAGWEHMHPYYEIVLSSSVLPNINDTAGRNKFDEKLNLNVAGERLFSTIGVSKTLSDRQSFKHTFLFTWNIPNLYAQSPEGISDRLEGTYYSNFFSDSNAVAQYMANNKEELETKTKGFHQNFFDSCLESFVLDQVNSHFNTFITSGWLTKDKNFGINEGMTDTKSWGPLATTDVGMYGSIMVAALFPELDKQTMRVHKSLQLKNGEVMHGIQRNFGQGDNSETVHSRLDMPSQYVIQTLRGYFWSNDKEYLNEMWPSIKLALDYCLNERDHDKDCIPDMEGVMCSYDNFPMYGAASYIASQWLAALQFAILAAKDMGELDIAEKYASVYEIAQKNAEQKLWNGSYFILSNDKGGKSDIVDNGCLTDQIIGQWASHMIGCGDIYDKSKITKALGHIVKHSFKEYGLINCRWPEDGFLHTIDENCWNDQANTCWTGVELGFAALLIHEGLVNEGLDIIKNVDDRHRKFGYYFDHAEFGGHYYRPLSAWGIINAFLGLSFAGTTYRFNPKVNGMKSNLFFTTGNATAHFTHNLAEGIVQIKIHTGEMVIQTLVLGSSLARAFEKSLNITVNNCVLSESVYDFTFDHESQALTVIFKKAVILKENEELIVKN